MKKTVRLTESDLIRLVKRVVNEQEEGLPGYEGFLEAINNNFPDADWEYESDDLIVFADNRMGYVEYDYSSRNVEVGSRFLNGLGFDVEDIEPTYIKDWVEESLGVVVNDVNTVTPPRRTIETPAPDMSLSEFTKKYVSLQRALFKLIGLPFSIEDGKMAAKDIFEREPGQLKTVINDFSEVVKSAREIYN